MNRIRQYQAGGVALTKPFITPVRDMNGNTLEYNVQDVDGSSRRISVADFLKLKDFELDTNDIQEDKTNEIDVNTVVSNPNVEEVNLDEYPDQHPVDANGQPLVFPPSFVPTQRANTVRPNQFEYATNWSNNTQQPVIEGAPGKQNFLSKGYQMIKDDIARRNEMRQRNKAAYWGDEQDRIQELNALGRDKKNALGALKKEGRMQMRIPNLETRNTELDNKKDFVLQRNPRRTEFVEGREAYQQGLNSLANQQRTIGMKGKWDRKGQNMTQNMSQKLATENMQTDFAPHIQLQKSVQLADKLALEKRQFDAGLEKKHENYINKLNNQQAKFQDKWERKSHRLNPNAGVVVPPIQLEYPTRTVLDTYEPDVRRNLDDFNSGEKTERFEKQRGGYPIAQFGINLTKPSDSLNTAYSRRDFNLGDPMQTYSQNLGDYNYDNNFTSRLATGNDSQAATDYRDLGNRTVSGQLSNMNAGRPTSVGYMNGSTPSITQTPGTKNGFNISFGSKPYGTYDLKYAGNRLQHQGNMIPANWNMAKYIFDKPEKEPFVAPSQMYTQKVITPDVLPLMRNKAQNMDLIRRNSRNTGDIMANIQQLHANTSAQEAGLANKVQMANAAEKSKFEVAKQDYADKYQQEILRKNATDRANRLSWENLGSDAMTEYQEALINKGKMLNQEYADDLSIKNYLNQISDDYKIIPDGKGSYNVEYVKNGQKVVLPISTVQQQAATNNVGATSRGTAGTPAQGSSTSYTVPQHKKGGMLKRRNSLY
jgi:hypothetical protein